MASCLGLYIETNVIKYAKVTKEHEALKVESFGIKFYDKLNETIKQIIAETFSYKTPISINLSEEMYNYFYMFNLLNKNDLKKAIETEFESFCFDKGMNKNAFEGRYALVNAIDDKNKVRVIYSYTNKELYLIFLKNGHVNYVTLDYKDTIEYKGQYLLNLDEYTKVVQSEKGFLLIPKNENRVVLYEAKSNKDIKEVNVKLDNKNTKVSEDYDKLKEKYNIKNKNLVNNMIYDDKKELLFVNYVNKDITIYSVKDKKLLKELKNVGTIDTYYGRDKNNRIYIGDISDSYILDSNYNKVGHVKSLVKVDKDKLIISNNGKNYSVKIYSLDEMLKEAKEYLK